MIRFIRSHFLIQKTNRRANTIDTVLVFIAGAVHTIFVSPCGMNHSYKSN